MTEKKDTAWGREKSLIRREMLPAQIIILKKANWKTKAEIGPAGFECTGSILGVVITGYGINPIFNFGVIEAAVRYINKHGKVFIEKHPRLYANA